jgi:DNA-binding CsgD family transcriptional regulator
VTGHHQPLLERQTELRALGELVSRLHAHSGGLVLLEGPAGIGKTALLDQLGAEAAASGARVLRARGGELERDDSFGVLQQLFGPPLDPLELSDLPIAAASALGGVDAATAPPGEDAGRAVNHALFSLCVRLAQTAPLLIVLDDAHWADEPSLRWLLFLARRLDRMPAALAIAHRPREPGTERALIDRLAAHDGATVIRPGPLGPSATAQMVLDVLGPPTDDAFNEACLRATGGNPFLLGELLNELSASGVRPSAQSAALALSVAPGSVARATLLRLARAPAAALPLAQALSILEECDLREAGALAGLDDAAATSAAVALGEAGLLAPGPRLRFVHPLVRSSIYAEIDERQRSRQHADAARVLGQSGASPERIAAHVMFTSPAENAGAVAALRAAARRAYTSGAPDAAARYLRRALEEPPSPEYRGPVLLELGRAEVRASHPDAVEHLKAAVEAAADDIARARALRELARGHMLGGRMDAATEAFEQAVELAAADRELRLALEGELAATLANLTSAQDAASRLTRYRDLSGETPAERAVLALLAFTSIQANEPAHIAADLIERAIHSGEFISEQTAGTIVFADGIMALILAEKEPRALAVLEGAAADAARLGWSIALSAAPFFQGWAYQRLGDLGAAQERTEVSLGVSRDRGWQAFTPMAAAVLCEIHLDRGELAAAEGALSAVGLAEHVPDSALFQLALYMRGRVRAARGDAPGALADLLLCGEREVALGGITPAAMAWRSNAALAHHALGQDDAARRLAAEEVALARALGTPRALGIALRAQGVISRGSEALNALRESVETLGRSHARLELARSMCELGAALRRGNHRRDAREPLREAVALAQQCGAHGLAQRARDELLAAGGRPRRDALRGIDALTASELRVAQLAALGHANREIASELVVTVRTVEFHLSRAYSKLGIASRSELARALNGGAQAPP